MIDIKSLLEGIRDTLVSNPQLAHELRDALKVRQPDRWLDATALKAEYGIAMRVVTDAAKYGLVKIGRRGRSPIVKVSEMERWLTTRNHPMQSRMQVSQTEDKTEYKSPLTMANAETEYAQLIEQQPRMKSEGEVEYEKLVKEHGCRLARKRERRR